jgi:hypothetical protein
MQEADQLPQSGVQFREGITIYLTNGGDLEKAQQMAAHESPRTTKLYDRRNDVVSLDEVEKVVFSNMAKTRGKRVKPPRGINVKQFVGFAGMLLAWSAAAEQPGNVAAHSTTFTRPGMSRSGHDGATGLICQTSARHKPAPKLVVTTTPSKVKINDVSKQGTPLAKIGVSWSNGAPFTGKLRLTKNPGGICQLAGLEVQLGRDTTKADDYKTLVCTITATK